MPPGLGGIGALAILLPSRSSSIRFSAWRCPGTGIVYTSDTISAVLLARPPPIVGPTAIEGFAMARRGEARPRSAARFASMIGG
jgi:TctA family transporter